MLKQKPDKPKGSWLMNNPEDGKPIQSKFQEKELLIGNYDEFWFYHRENDDYELSLDIAAHEYTHGVVYYTSDPDDEEESGAVLESFCDIMGNCIEDHVENGNGDWDFGEDASSESFYIRSFADPNSSFHHLDISTCESDGSSGQPDTYHGTFWSYIECENSTYVNAGVGNKWFHLLAFGGSGTNDNGDSYAVQGIGVSNAEWLAYNTMTSLASLSSYNNAWSTSTILALEKWGECSPEYIQNERAWHAVGVAYFFDECTPYSIEETVKKELELSVWPNPTSDQLNVLTNVSNSHTYELLDPGGRSVLNQSFSGEVTRIDVSSIPNGVYLLKVRNKYGTKTERVLIVR